MVPPQISGIRAAVAGGATVTREELVINVEVGVSR